MGVQGGQGKEEAKEGEAALDVNVPKPESDMETPVCSPTPNPVSIYSTPLSPPTPTPIPIYSTVTSTAQVPPVLVPTCNSITEILRYAFGHAPHPSLILPAAALVQSMMSAQRQITSPMVSPSPPFNIYLDPADLDFLKKKLSDSQESQMNILLDYESQILTLRFLQCWNKYCTKDQERH